MNWYKRFAVLAVLLTALLFVIITNIRAGHKEYTAGVTFLPDNQLLPALLKDFDESRSEIRCALYMFKTDKDSSSPTSQLLNAMLRALERGVQVGIIFETAGKTDITTKYNTHTGKTLTSAGAKIVFDSPDQRLHTKMCVIDSKTVYIGSHNYTFSAMERNAEVTVRIRSPEVAAESLSYLGKLGL